MCTGVVREEFTVEVHHGVFLLVIVTCGHMSMVESLGLIMLRQTHGLLCD
jgi:hypothetical protein